MGFIAIYPMGDGIRRHGVLSRAGERELLAACIGSADQANEAAAAGAEFDGVRVDAE